MSAASRHAAWTQRLVRQTLAIPDPGDPSASTALAEDALVDLVHRVLQRGSDRPIHAALAQLLANHQDDAAERLRFWADFCASTRDDLAMPSTQGTDAEALATTIFLLPIIALLPPHAVWPAPLTDDVVLTPIAHSFRRHGLLGEAPSILIAPPWYPTADLPTTWSGRRRWIDYGIHAVLHHGQSLFPPANASMAPGPDPSLQLRWIVGIVIEAADDDPLPWLDDASDHFAIDDAVWDAWESTMTHTLEPLFAPDTTLWIGRPGAWTPTVIEGVVSFHRIALGLQLDLFPPAALVHIRHTEAATWTIQWTHAGHAKHYLWTIPDDPDESLLAIVAALRSNAVDSMTIHALPTVPES